MEVQIWELPKCVLSSQFSCGVMNRAPASPIHTLSDDFPGQHLAPAAENYAFGSAAPLSSASIAFSRESASWRTDLALQ